MSKNGQVLEHHVAVRVIEVAVRVNQHAQRLAGRCADRVPEHPTEARILLSIDDEHSVGRLDSTGIRVAAGADPSNVGLGTRSRVSVHLSWLPA